MTRWFLGPQDGSMSDLHSTPDLSATVPETHSKRLPPLYLGNLHLSHQNLPSSASDCLATRPQCPVGHLYQMALPMRTKARTQATTCQSQQRPHWERQLYFLAFTCPCHKPRNSCKDLTESGLNGNKSVIQSPPLRTKASSSCLLSLHGGKIMNTLQSYFITCYVKWTTNYFFFY